MRHVFADTDDSPPVLELTCPASSPLQGDAPLEPPILGIVTGGRRSPGRSYKRQRSSRSGSKSHGEDEAEVGETPSCRPEAVHEGTPLGTPPALPAVGVGRRTSVLFKKAKNGARACKKKCSPQHNGKAGEDPTDGLDSPHGNITVLPLTPPSPSPRHLRSRGHGSDGEADKDSGEAGEQLLVCVLWIPETGTLQY